MRPIESSKTVRGKRRAWKAPTVKKLAIGTETKAIGVDPERVTPQVPVSEQPNAAHPQPPAAPATKLGFSYELSFPLSARYGE